MKIKRKNQKGGSTPSPSIRILTDYRGLNLNNIDITTIPVRATLSNIELPQQSEILSEIQTQQNDIQDIEKNIETQKTKTKTKVTKEGINKLAQLDEELENNIRKLEIFLRDNINKIKKGLNVDMNYNSRKDVSAFIGQDKIFPFYSFYLIMIKLNLMMKM